MPLAAVGVWRPDLCSLSISLSVCFIIIYLLKLSSLKFWIMRKGPTLLQTFTFGSTYNHKHAMCSFCCMTLAICTMTIWSDRFSAVCTRSSEPYKLWVLLWLKKNAANGVGNFAIPQCSISAKLDTSGCVNQQRLIVNLISCPTVVLHQLLPVCLTWAI